VGALLRSGFRMQSEYHNWKMNMTKS